MISQPQHTPCIIKSVCLTQQRCKSVCAHITVWAPCSRQTLVLCGHLHLRTLPVLHPSLAPLGRCSYSDIARAGTHPRRITSLQTSNTKLDMQADLEKLELVDLDQVDADEQGKIKPCATGLAAEIRASWLQSIEVEVEARLAERGAEMRATMQVRCILSVFPLSIAGGAAGGPQIRNARDPAGARQCPYIWCFTCNCGWQCVRLSRVRPRRRKFIHLLPVNSASSPS